MTPPKNTAFAYQEVYHYLVGLIEAANGTTEQKLPSLRQLALRLGVSVSTTKYAYALLVGHSASVAGGQYLRCRNVPWR